jgi:hypothetical protein
MNNRLGLSLPALYIGGGLSAGLVGYAGYSVGDLFIRLGSSLPEAVLAAVSSVGVAVALTAIAVLDNRPTVRGMCGLLLVIWQLLTLALVSFAGVQRASALRVEAFAEVGRVVAVLLPALALVPLVVVPLAAREKPDRYPSAAAAAGHYLSFVVKALAVGASALAAGYFGLRKGMPAEVAALCAVLLEGSVLWSYLRLTEARQRRDLFDALMWTLMLILFGAFIAAVSVETVSTLARVNVPLLAPLREAGDVLFVSATGLTVALMVVTHALTALIDVRAGRGGVIEGLARGVAKARADAQMLGDAVRGKPLPPERRPLQGRDKQEALDLPEPPDDLFGDALRRGK